jgi:hypothetical protein
MPESDTSGNAPGGETGLVYVEFVSRRPGVDLHQFHAAQLQAQAGWAGGHTEDLLIWQAARTWRLGPEPEYLVVWYTPGCGLERIDEWDRIFRAGGDDHHERPARQVARIDVAGCYTALRPPVAARKGSYYAEFFAPTGTPDAVRELYDRRAALHPRLTLNLLACRIGHLAPNPGGLAVWTLPDFASLAEIATELEGMGHPVHLHQAGTYHDVGEEIL